MSGFMVDPDPDPSRRRSIAEQIAFRFELEDQTFEAVSWMLMNHKRQLAALESRVAMLEALLLGTGGTG